MRKYIIAALLLGGLSSMAWAQNEEEAAPPFPSPNAIVDAAPASEWITIKPSDLMVMDLAADRDGKERRVIIQLMPEPFSQGWIRNIRKLTAAKFWDATAIIRVQDNYVTQWGDPNSGEESAKALPEGLETVPESEYRVPPYHDNISTIIKAKGPREIYSDWAKSSKSGWPIAGNSRGFFWPVHCYAMVGVGRDLSPNTGDGSSLYTVIGHAPRHLDRNIALVGRIISGMEHMSSLPRGTGDLGFYETPEERTQITSVRMGNDISDIPDFEYLNTQGESFAKYADARANRRDPFFNIPAGGADICNIPVPIRVKKDDKK